jgi:cytochrome c553
MARTFPPNLAGVLSVASALATASPAFAAGGDKAFGEYLAGECTACHLVSGQQVGGIPAIIGLPEDAFIAMMKSYARKERENQVMRNIAAKFQPDELAALAAYFGSLKPR